VLFARIPRGSMPSPRRGLDISPIILILIIMFIRGDPYYNLPRVFLARLDLNGS